MIPWTNNTLMLWAGQKVSDHNRQPVSVSYERIGNQQRMANGQMRQYWVADKRTWSVSWNLLPSRNGSGLTTADLGMSASQLESFYQANKGGFQMTLKAGDGSTETVNVLFTEFSKEITKRGTNTDLWTVSATLTEV